jgi:precorrin-8X/cobalt-precorrin-8 methylmutase
MEKIVIVGHGSPKSDANTVEKMAPLIHHALHPHCAAPCVKVAYLQFAQPDIETALDACVAEGARRIIVHPFFLYAGMHVTKDIPEKIAEARRKYPQVEIAYTEPLGLHGDLTGIVLERINAVRFPAAEAIEARSFEIISEEADFSGLPEERLPIIKRVIHATADFEFKTSLFFHPDAVKAGIEAIRAGKDILTDVEMVRTGINKRLLGRWGGQVYCAIGDGQGEEKARAGATRAEQGIEKALTERPNLGIIAVGNAPTALLKVIERLHGERAPATLPLVVGVPVGFVRALESKTLLASQRFPFITNLSRKGGTPAAVAIVNALLKMATEAA